MYAFFKGEVAEKGTEYVVLDVHDIGYLIKLSATTVQILPGVGEVVKLYTYTSVHEDDISLFGFLTKEELDLFKMLINVNGIGPKGAQSILSVLPADSLRFAIVSGDAGAIAKAPGIGSKTAQRVILDLKDKISIEDTLHALGQTAENPDTGLETPSAVKEAVEALTALGYASSDALKAVQMVDHAEELETEALLKAALKHIF